MRRGLTLEAQLKGTTKAIASPKLPPQLRESLVRRAGELQRMLERKKRRPGLLENFRSLL
jgi:hypothetical protein